MCACATGKDVISGHHELFTKVICINKELVHKYIQYSAKDIGSSVNAVRFMSQVRHYGKTEQQYTRYLYCITKVFPRQICRLAFQDVLLKLF